MVRMAPDGLTSLVQLSANHHLSPQCRSSTRFFSSSYFMQVQHPLSPERSVWLGKEPEAARLGVLLLHPNRPNRASRISTHKRKMASQCALTEKKAVV